MASNTTTKKEIVDFLWDWASLHDDWGKLLIASVVRSENALSIEDREEIFNYFIDSLRSSKKISPLNIIKPVYIPSDKTIYLNSLKNVIGVNRLAKNQCIKFNKNITVIYGENGTGKTGYGRILKSLGFSYDTNTSIFNDINGNPIDKTATIEFETNGNSETFNWNGSNNHPELSNISVFNSNCVNLSLNDRQLIVSPIGFHLFSLVTTELTALSSMLKLKISTYNSTLSWSDLLHISTPQYEFINSLSNKSTDKKLTDLSNFNSLHASNLIQKEKELAELNKALLKTQIVHLSTQVNELNTIITKIKFTASVLNATSCESIIKLTKNIIALENKTIIGLKEIAEAKGITFYESKEFKDFISTAEKYIKILGKKEYPEENDKCIYCNQPLETEARKLLTQYKDLLNDTTQSDLRKLTEEKDLLLQSIKKTDTNIIISLPVFGTDSFDNCIQPQEIINYNQKIETLKNQIQDDTTSGNLIFNFKYEPAILFFENKKKQIQQNIEEKNVKLSDIVAGEAKLLTEINELKDRKLLSEKVEEVKKVINNKKIIEVLNSKTSEFNTASLSRKTSEAREHLVRQNFDSIFQSELAAFRKSHLKIELSFITDRGSSKVTQRIKDYLLIDILSEGEQKAIALAEFLTELQLDNIKAPVIFDDPVNSLDHRIIEEVAKRFILLSKNRQVIIFTHSILLLNSFIQQNELATNKQAGIDFTFYAVKNNFQETGIIDDVEEINSFSFYKKKLNSVLTTNSAGQNEAKLAAEGYGHLRAAIEICVEENLLQSTIKRYRKGVAFPALLRIEGNKIDVHKGTLNDIYEKCCISIDGHSSPSEVQTTSTISELKADFDLFMETRKNFLQT